MRYSDLQCILRFFHNPDIYNEFSQHWRCSIPFEKVSKYTISVFLSSKRLFEWPQNNGSYIQFQDLIFKGVVIMIISKDLNKEHQKPKCHRPKIG